MLRWTLRQGGLAAIATGHLLSVLAAWVYCTRIKTTPFDGVWRQKLSRLL